ncbi:MAG: porphobilinogen synthase [Candidatus Comchoanobacterales bacterium]
MIDALFPATRLRRNRRTPWLRQMVAEHHIQASDLIWPVFIQERGITEIAELPECFRYDINGLIKALYPLVDQGLCCLALFPVIAAEHKDDKGSYATSKHHYMLPLIAEIKRVFPQLGIMVDVALDPYTTHGHDGVLDANGLVDNDATIAILAEQACLLAEAGADIIAPSDMQDGRVGKIRALLEAKGHQNIVVLSYAAKYASTLYGPFRHAVGSAAQLAGKGKETYQQDPANAKEALREVALDLREGADWVMVKPAGAYLDVIYRVASEINAPVMAYQVSGEYAMLEQYIHSFALDRYSVHFEHLLSIKRAGARAILSYATPLMLSQGLVG